MAKYNKADLEKINSQYFDQAYVDNLYNIYLDDNKKSKEEIKNLAAEIKSKYLEIDNKLKEEIKVNVEAINKATKLEIDSINGERDSKLSQENDRYSKIINPSKADKTEHTNIVKGIEIVCKRAKIKANNSNYNDIKTEKMKRYHLHVEYVNLTYYVTEKINPVENVRSRVIEDKAQFDIKRSLTNKKMWANLIPFFMLVLMILAYVIARAATGYKGDLTAVINSGIFVAVVATGAVYIYSQGGFDMSLGNAALMCALLAGITFKSTGNIFLSLLVAIIVGAGLGIINAVLATMLNLPVMVMTLTMMNIIAAINDAIIGGKMFDLKNATGMITSPWIYALFLLVFFIICWFIFNFTKVGRRNKFIGSNKTAAKFNGINLMKAGIVSFAISGVGIGICGFIYINSQSGLVFNPAGSVLGQVGLNVIIAIVFGGMTTSGGPKSKISCAIIGAFFVVFLEEFFNALNMAIPVGNYKYLVKGIVFILVSLANMWDTRTKRLASGGSIQ